MQFATPDVAADRQRRYEIWIAGVSRPRPYGHEFVATPARPLNWTPLSKPLSECTVALVTTAGVHLKSQEPFAVYLEEGDWSSRRIPGEVSSDELTATHTHYDTRDALDDINVVFPIDRLRELTAEGVIGRASPVHYGFMGFIPDPKVLLGETAPAAARDLKAQGVDAVFLTAG
jgi:D-proline reductase (dithiol) PrdB